MKPVKEYSAALLDKNFRPTALKVAVVVGSILFTINHGNALVNGKMTRDRWLAALITYCVPYCVNIHGQYISRRTQDSRMKSQKV